MGAQLQPAHDRHLGALADAGRRLRAAVRLQQRPRRAGAVAGHRHEWRDENRVLRVTTRDGVRWSDGAPFSARDVAFTFELLKRFPALDKRGAVELPGRACARWTTRTVDFTLPARLHPRLRRRRGPADRARARLAAGGRPGQRSPTRTRWPPGPSPRCASSRTRSTSSAGTPTTGSRARPGRGAALPRLPVQRPRQPGAGLRRGGLGRQLRAGHRPGLRGARSPKHHAYWFPLTGTTIFLYANTTPRPRSTTCGSARRSAWRIDRELVVEVAALPLLAPRRRHRPLRCLRRRGATAAAAAGDWVRHDVTRANALLDEAGHRRGAGRPPPPARRPALEVRGHGGLGLVRLGAGGPGDRPRPARAGRRRLGPHLRLRRLVRSGCRRANFDLTIGWSFEGPTPYTFYRWLMSSATVKPVGTVVHVQLAPLREPGGRPAAGRVRARGRSGRRSAASPRRCSGSSRPRRRPSRSTPTRRGPSSTPAASRASPRRPTPTPTLPPTSSTAARPCWCSPRSSRASGAGMRYILKRLGFYLLAAGPRSPSTSSCRGSCPAIPATALFARFKGRLAPRRCDGLRETFGLTDAPLLQPVPHLPRPRGCAATWASRWPTSRRRSRTVIGSGLAWTLFLAGTAVVLSFAIGTLLGVAAAWWRGGWADTVAAARLRLPRRLPLLLAGHGGALRARLHSCGWFPLGHAYGDDLTPGWNLAFMADVCAPRRAAHGLDRASPPWAAGCWRCATR